MIKLSVMYPFQPGARFDHDYYRDHHMPLLKRLMGTHCKYYTIEKGLAGAEPGSTPPFIAMCHVYCDAVEDLQAGIGPHVGEIMADIANYTDLVPIQQLSDVVVERSA